MRDLLRCGNCRESKIELFNVCNPEDRRAERKRKLIARCTGCKEETVIELEPATIRIRPAAKSTSNICGGWK